MKISFNQPAFIPWGGFFARLLHSEQMVLLDDTLFARGFTFVNRNRLKGPDGEVWNTVPVKKKGRGRQRIKELIIDDKNRWASKFLATLTHCYGKSPYFDQIFSRMKMVIETDNAQFMPLVVELLQCIRDELQIPQGFVLQSDLEISGTGTQLLLSLAHELKATEIVLPFFAQKAVDVLKFEKKNMAVTFLRYSPSPYPQMWGHFIKNLSAIDLLMCLGKSGQSVLKKGSTLYQS